MPSEGNLSLRRAKRTGLWICLGTVLAAGVFLAALLRQSYWALALPVAVGVLSALGLSFWIGYTINTVRGIPPEADQYEGRQARLIAKGICAVSILLALIFLAGLAWQSYWALAIPVAGAVLGLAAMIFWIGWAILTQRSTLAEAEAEPEPEPEPDHRATEANPGDGGGLPADAGS